MLDPEVQTSQDRRPGIVICAYEADDAGWDPVEDLSGRFWDPPGARTVAVFADEPDALVSALAEHLRSGECQGVLLVGRSARAPGFRIQMRAENHAPGQKQRLGRTGTERDHGKCGEPFHVPGLDPASHIHVLRVRLRLKYSLYTTRL